MDYIVVVSGLVM